MQVRLTHFSTALRDGRFLTAVLVGNFVLVPFAVWVLLPLAGWNPAVRLGVVIVLVVPCTDWFVTFAHLGGGDTRRAVAVTPINLLFQLALLPFYVTLLSGESVADLVPVGRATTVFVTLIVVPLLAAAVAQRWMERREARAVVLDRIGRLIVPLLALVVFLIAVSQIVAVRAFVDLLPRLVAVYGTFLVVAALGGLVVGRLFRLRPGATRVVVFSLGTRNSFVVLPFALALPATFELTAVVIVFQSLVELFGMVAYLRVLRVVPRLVPITTSLS